jgi:hypothetical protein
MNRYWSDRFVNASIARAARGAEKDKEIDMGERQKAYPVAAAREITELEAELSALKWDHSRLQDRCTELVNENDKFREALGIIAGKQPCVDSLMGNAEIAKAALETIKAAYVEGWSEGHNEGLGCGHALAPKCRHKASEEWLDSDALTKALGD